jgi:hypothetical protein
MSDDVASSVLAPYLNMGCPSLSRPSSVAPESKRGEAEIDVRSVEA